VEGHVDGDSRAQALFNSPYSICMTNDGTMYVADHWNMVIRKISPDGSTVSTLFGKRDANMPTKAQIEGGDEILAVNYDLWCPAGTASFANSYAVAPQVLRVSSTGNLMLGEAWSLAVRYVDLKAQTVRRVGIFGANPHTRLNYEGKLIGPNGNTWFWMDVDSRGTCGPADDIVLFQLTGFAQAGLIWRISFDGNYSNGFGGDTGFLPEQIGGGGHYPWVIAISRTQARMISGGVANQGLFLWRAKQPGDPVVDLANQVGIDRAAYARGRYIYETGSCPNFPWGARPGFRQLRGPLGVSRLGIPETIPFDTLMSLYPDDASLGAYIQAGFGGLVPRPELTGDDLADLIYFIRRSSLPGSFPKPLASRGPFATDVTPPVISNVVATRLASPNTRIRVTWTTNKPTIGFAAAGSPSSHGTKAPYNVWSPIESGYSTSHDVTITGLPTATPTHLVVLSKDEAGNSAATLDMAVA
jgi:hypothetical protein